MRLDRVGLLVALVVLPLSVMGQVFTRAPEDLMWSVSTLFGGFIGLALHICFSWGEWRKLTKRPMSFREYVWEDLPGFFSAWLLATTAYFALPMLAQIPAVQSFLGFAPGMNFLSAAAATYIASSLGYKIRAYFLGKGGG